MWPISGRAPEACCAVASTTANGYFGFAACSSRSLMQNGKSALLRRVAHVRARAGGEPVVPDPVLVHQNGEFRIGAHGACRPLEQGSAVVQLRNGDNASSSDARADATAQRPPEHRPAGPKPPDPRESVTQDGADRTRPVRSAPSRASESGPSTSTRSRRASSGGAAASTRSASATRPEADIGSQRRRLSRHAGQPDATMLSTARAA